MTKKHAAFLVLWFGLFFGIPLGLAIHLGFEYLIFLLLLPFAFLVPTIPYMDTLYNVYPITRKERMENDLIRLEQRVERLTSSLSQVKALRREMAMHGQHEEAAILAMRIEVLVVEEAHARADVIAKEREIRSRRMIELTRGD